MDMQTTQVHPKILSGLAGIAPGMCVGDFGCGAHGALVHHLADKVGENGCVYALDIRPSALELVGRGHGYGLPAAPIETVWSDLEQYGAASIAHGSLDRIFLVEVLSALLDMVAALRECERLLAPEGSILVVDWAHRGHPLAPAQVVSPRMVTQAAQDTGFLESAGFIPLSSHHWGVLLKRI